MKGKTHLISGLIAGAAVGVATGSNAEMMIASVTLAGIGSLVPDLDHQNSLLSRRVWWLPVHWLFTHRGITHSPLIPSVLAGAALAWLVDPLPLLAFAAGYAAHLAGDGLTKSGIYLLPARRLHLLPARLRLSTGGAVESWLLLALLVASLPVLVSAGSVISADSVRLASLVLYRLQHAVKDILLFSSGLVSLWW